MADFLPPVTALLTCDVSEFVAKMGLAKEALAELTDSTGTESETVRITADTADADAKIDHFDEKLAAIPNEEHVEVVVDTTGAGAGLDNLKKKADSASGKDGAGQGLSGLVAAGLALGPALVPVGAVAAGAILTVGGAFAAAASGIGAFALAAAGSLTTVEAQASATLSSWQDSMQSIVAPVVEQFGALVAPALAAITPLVEAVVPALSQVAAMLTRTFASPELHQFVAFLGAQAGPAITSFAGFFVNLGAGVASMFETAGPLLTDFEGILDRIGPALARIGSSPQFEAFIAYIQANGPLVARTLGDIGHDAVLLVQDLATVGPSVLQIVDVAARLLGELLSLNPTLVGWGIALGGAALGANRLLGSLGGIPGAVRLVTTAISMISDASILGSAGLYSVATAAGGVPSVLAGIGSSALLAVPGLDLVAAALLNQTGVFSDFDQAANAAGRSWAQNFVATLPAGTNAVTAAKDEIASLTLEFNNAASAVDAAGVKFSHGGNEYAAAIAAPQAAIEALSPKIQQLTGLLPQLQAAQDRAAVSSATLSQGYLNDAFSSGALNVQTGLLTTAQKALATATTAVTSALQTLEGSNISNALAEDQWRTSIDAATASATKNSAGLDLNTAAGLTNKSTFDQLTQQALTYISSLVQQGATTDRINSVMAGQMTQLEAVGRNMGLTKAQTDQYLASLGLIPSTVDTQLNLNGYALDMQNIQNIQANLDALHDKTITITVTAAIQAAAQALLPSIESTTPAAAGPAVTTHARALAAGGYVTQPTLAMVGESGPEIVLPVALLKQMGDTGVTPLPNFRPQSNSQAAAGAGGGGGDLILELDSVTVARVAGPQIRAWLLRTGRSTVNLGLS